MPIDRTSTSAVNPFQDKSASFHRRVFRYTGPTSYTTGGEALSPANQFGVGRIYCVLGTLWNGTNFYVVHWDRTNNKLLVVDPSTKAEVAAAANTSTYSGVLEAIGL